MGHVHHESLLAPSLAAAGRSALVGVGSAPLVEVLLVVITAQGAPQGGCLRQRACIIQQARKMLGKSSGWLLPLVVQQFPQKDSAQSPSPVSSCSVCSTCSNCRGCIFPKCCSMCAGPAMRTLPASAAPPPAGEEVRVPWRDEPTQNRHWTAAGVTEPTGGLLEGLLLLLSGEAMPAANAAMMA